MKYKIKETQWYMLVPRSPKSPAAYVCDCNYNYTQRSLLCKNCQGEKYPPIPWEELGLGY